MKYKIGQILKVKESSRGECGEFEDREDSKYIKITEVGDTYYEYDILNSKKEIISNCSVCLTDKDLEPLTKDWDDLEVGDEMKNEFGVRTVLGVCGRVIFVSDYNDKDMYAGGLTKEELIKDSFIIVQDEPVEEVVELTVKEICDKLGYEVKIKKE